MRVRADKKKQSQMRKTLLFKSVILVLFGCKNVTQENGVFEASIQTNDLITSIKDSADVMDLMKKVLAWQDSKDQIGTLPLKGNDSSVCIGVDYELQKENLKKLQASNYFTTSFILNYKRIIDRFDEIIKKGEVEKFDIGEMAPFSFATDASPWCNCQDNFGWDKIVAKEIRFDKNSCELKWGWNKWTDYSYRVKLKKENEVWKIDEMEGFDFNEATKIY